MNPLFIFVTFLTAALAFPQITIYPKPRTCRCPPVRCPTEIGAQCLCHNGAEQRCWEAKRDAGLGSVCPSPTPRICPTIQPSPTPSPTGNCECETVFCIQQWPESCHCQNDGLKRCHEKCGGPKPKYEECPVVVETTILPTNTSSPTSTNQICGGFRVTPRTCPEGHVCINNPFDPTGCGQACDLPGICALERMCGGFAGLKCPQPGQVCVDDPRDSCNPKDGGNDCGGLCVWPEQTPTPTPTPY